LPLAGIDLVSPGDVPAAGVHTRSLTARLTFSLGELRSDEPEFLLT